MKYYRFTDPHNGDRWHYHKCDDGWWVILDGARDARRVTDPRTLTTLHELELADTARRRTTAA